MAGRLSRNGKLNWHMLPASVAVVIALCCQASVWTSVEAACKTPVPIRHCSAASWANQDQLCGAVGFVCGQLGCSASQRDCGSSNLRSNANTLMDKWYQKAAYEQGPDACNFGGIGAITFTTGSFYNGMHCRSQGWLKDSDLCTIARYICNTGGGPCTAQDTDCSQSGASWRKRVDFLMDWYLLNNPDGGTNSCNFNGGGETYRYIPCGNAPSRPVLCLNTPAARIAAVKNTTVPIRGVNLGSWLVVERPMAPLLFAGVPDTPNVAAGEYQLMTTPGVDGVMRIRRHRSSWIKANDFNLMSSYGLNLVRLPVGHWVMDDLAPYAPGSLKYVDRAFAWGNKYGIAVMLDLHAAPGSQSGQDHSSPENPGQTNWDKDPANVQRSVQVIEFLANRYASNPALFGINLLNEPGNVNVDTLKDYYRQCYRVIRKHSSTAWLILAAARFRDGLWINFMHSGLGYQRVMLDTHRYNAFAIPHAPLPSLKFNDHIRWALEWNLPSIQSLVNTPQANYLIVGEWSLAGPQYWKEFDDAGAKAAVKNFAVVQQRAWRAAQGWIFWSWRYQKEDIAPLQRYPFERPHQIVWSLVDLFAEGMFPVVTNGGKC